MGSIIWDSKKNKKATIRLKPNTYAGRIGAGTPFNANGEIANDATAIGLSVHDIACPYKYTLEIIVAGCVDEKSRKEKSGIELTEECKNALCNIEFVNFDGDASFGGGSVNTGGNANIDVTATVGQTIVVEEVDANGKPTKWKAADYQPRTHWTDETIVLPETTVECVEMDTDEDGVGDGLFMGMLPDVSLTPNADYAVVYNGVRYVCKAALLQDDEEERTFVLGNYGVITGVGNTGEPVVFLFTYFPSEGYSENLVLTLDGSASVTLSITEVKVTPVPIQYVSNAFPYYIEVSGSGTDDDPYVCNDTVENVNAIYDSGRQLIVKKRDIVDSEITLELHIPFYASVKAADGRRVYIFNVVVDKTSEPVIFTLESQADGTFAVGDSMFK